MTVQTENKGTENKGTEDKGTEGTENKGTEGTGDAGTGDAGTDGDKTFDAAYVATLRKEAAKYRTQAKEAADKAKKFDESEAAGKTDLQKANDEAAEAKAQLEAVQTDLLRATIASAKKLPPALADRLRGKNKEEMEADADSLMAELGKGFVAKGGSSADDTGAGVKGDSIDYEGMSPKDLVKAIRERDH